MIKKSLSLFSILCTIGFISPGYAQEATPGDACTTSGAVSIAGGVETSGVSYMMVCDGANWVQVFATAADGSVEFGGELTVGETTGLACSSSTEGSIRYDSASNVLELCDGSSWNSVNVGCDVTPDGFDFTNVTDATFSTTYTTSIQEMTGLTCGVTVSISGTGSPEYRTCSDSSCSSVVQSWTSSNGTISNNEYLQLRVTSGDDSLLVRTATVNVGGAVDSFSVTTQNLGTYKRIFMSRSDRSGGDYGGLSGADAVCQADADAEGLGGTYYAWMSTDSTDDPESRFTQASVPYVHIGGGTVANNWADLVDGYINDGIENSADGTNEFSCNPWTNTNTDGTAYSDTDNCNDWTSDGIGYIALRGTGGNTDSSWTSTGSSACNAAYCIICVEQ